TDDQPNNKKSEQHIEPLALVLHRRAWCLPNCSSRQFELRRFAIAVHNGSIHLLSSQSSSRFCCPSLQARDAQQPVKPGIITTVPEFGRPDFIPLGKITELGTAMLIQRFHSHQGIKSRFAVE